MLTDDKNQLLTRVGPGTPMNALFKQYWMPALLSSDLPEPEGDPRAFTMLGERYVAFRDTTGRVGVMNETCCHRGASLALGRVEDGGIRCIFHGWKFACDGTLLDTPNVADPAFKARVRAKAYPVREAGDLIWVYLGSDDPPPFREYEYLGLPPEHRMVMRMELACNYLQVLEGGLDSSHVGILHRDMARSFDETPDELPDHLQQNRQELLTDLAPTLEVRETEFGFHYAALREANDGTARRHARITAYVAPTTLMIPPNLFIVHDVPIDDTHTQWIVTHWDPERPVDRERMLRVMGLHTGGVWVDGRMDQTAANGYRQDRSAMRRGSWSGLFGLGPEDAAINLSQGPVLDRSAEHLVAADVACARLRRLMLENVDRVSRGEEALGRRPTSAATIRAIEVTIDKEDAWNARVPGNVELPSLART